MSHLCPFCGNTTRYQILSGGQEWWCESCGTQGAYEPADVDDLPPRVLLLRKGSPESLAVLRRQMREELDRREKQP